MTKPPLLIIDTRDDRRELWSLLHRLSPRDRVRFLVRCCARLKRPDAPSPVVNYGRIRDRVMRAYSCEKANEGVTNEVYGDLLVCGAAPWHLDLLAVACELEQIVKGRLELLPV